MRKTDRLNIPRGWTFGPIPSEVLESDLSTNAKVTVAAVLYHAWDGGPCWPGMERLATLTSLSRRSVMRAVQELESHQPPFLAVERVQGKANNYRFLSATTSATQSPVTPPTSATQSRVPVTHSHPTSATQSPELDTLTRSKERQAAEQPAVPPKVDPVKFTAWYCEQYQQRFGVKYAHAGAKDMLAVKRLLATYGEDQARALVLFAFDCSDPFYRRVSSSLAGLVSQAARIAALQAETIPAGRKPGEVPLNPPKVWRHEGRVYRLDGWPRYVADDGAVVPEDLVRKFS